MSFWEEHHRAEGAKLAAEAHKPKPLSKRGKAAAQVVARLPEVQPARPCTVCGTNPADLYGTCLPCDVVDGYLDLRETP